MKIKDLMKMIVGADRLSYMKGVVCHYGCNLKLAINKQKKFNYASNDLRFYKEFYPKPFYLSCKNIECSNLH